MAGKRRFVPEQLLPPDQVNPRGLRPFKQGEFLDNLDGSYSTERTMSFNIGGKEVLAPSLWMTDKGPVDLGRYPDTIIRAVQEYETRTGKKFPRFNTPAEADAFAKQRSIGGGASNNPLEN